MGSNQFDFRFGLRSWLLCLRELVIIMFSLYASRALSILAWLSRNFQGKYKEDQS